MVFLMTKLFHSQLVEQSHVKMRFSQFKQNLMREYYILQTKLNMYLNKYQYNSSYK